MHAPVRTLMERKLVGHVRPSSPSIPSSTLYFLAQLTGRVPYPQNPHMPALRTSNLHLDILMGRDDTLEPADFMMPGTFCLVMIDILCCGLR